MKITDEEIEYFKEADKIVKRGYYPNGQKAIDTYKKIFAEEIANGKMRDNFNPKCGGCIRQVVEITINKIKELEKKIKDETGTEKEDKGTGNISDKYKTSTIKYNR